MWGEVHPDGVSDDEDEGEGAVPDKAGGGSSRKDDELEGGIQPALATSAAQPKGDSPAIEVELETSALVDTVTAKLHTSRLVEAAG